MEPTFGELYLTPLGDNIQLNQSSMDPSLIFLHLMRTQNVLCSALLEAKQVFLSDLLFWTPKRKAR